VHVGVVIHVRGRAVCQLRDTSSQRLDYYEGRCNVGSTSRCAAARAQVRAQTHADRLIARLHAARHARQIAVYAESLAERSGEEV
jgi:hypothetical protein